MYKRKAKRESTNFYQRVLTANPMIYQTKRILKNHGLDTGSLPEIYESLSDELESWKEFYREDSTDPEEKEISVELDYLFKKLKSFSEFLELFRQGSDDEFVVWMDPSSVSDKNIYYDLHIQPLNSSDLLRERFFSELSTLVFTSATLTTGKNKFEYFFHQIGSSSFDTGNFPSPFPYSKNCLIYLPRNISDPAEKPDDFVEELQLLIPKLLELTEGNSFLLFTSNKLLNEVYKLISEIVDYPCISQLEWGAEKAKQMYLETDHAVLFGVSTFWQGIDIRGDKLKSVLIIKLPFQPPGEPVLETKIENLKKKNGNPFMEIQLPHSILTLKQGFGRLIRSGTDKGFVAILDPRIQTKRYGGDLLKSLPPAKLVYSYKELRENYKELLGG